MFAIETLRELFRHMEWADATVWQAVATLNSLPPDTRLRDRLLHIHTVQRAFLLVWTGRPVVFPKRDDFSDLGALQRWTQPYYEETKRFLGNDAASRLQEGLALPWVQQFEKRTGRSFATPTLAETIFQVTSHSTYHRGQVNTRLRELGVEPPLVDYIAWLWFGKPAPQWPQVLQSNA
jgi:uncharacterized damage-inducible protein DinB